MVYLHFPSQMTEEEEMLKKKYEKLRRKKKALQNLNAPKQEPPPPKPLVRSLEAKPDAKEVAKKLLKSGAISAIKVEHKERQGFKRPKALERKRNACERTSGSVAGYQPFTASHSAEEEASNAANSADSSASPSNSPRPPVKKLYESFVSSRKLEDEIKEERARDIPRRERDRDGRPERPRQGNTVYVRGYGVTQEILQKTFEPIGNIINISMEMDKNCGFVTFEKIDQAEKAIKEMSGTQINGMRLNVSLARRQPLIPPLGEDSSSSSWSTLAVNFPQKGNHEDTRELVVYDEI
ncbi:negative elongation factor E [Parasteatoda tepidariorum]|uniref:Negative elongation factor E n=1 Tax=Parasteatoda tepidariorum TaxID=114398 RepID=A0A2L2YM59_PARTP|nr:negative elongation factor E [Parasteatoda tepidariorum]